MLVENLKRIRSLASFWIAKQSPEHLEQLRRREFEFVKGYFPTAADVLEIGAGTGWQARLMHDEGHNVTAIDLPESNYSHARVWPVIDYDGQTIPFEDKSFDVVFSSNVLEHIPHLRDFQSEIERVLRDDGTAIHIVPSGIWRFWTNITHVLRRWSIPNVHGELAGNCVSEVYFFSRLWWRSHFQKTGWVVVQETTTPLFYTGHSIFDSRLSIAKRAWLARLLGSSCNVFLLKCAAKKTNPSPVRG
jgi:SAM-dependent methyltransferase